MCECVRRCVSICVHVCVCMGRVQLYVHVRTYMFVEFTLRRF